MTQDTMIDQYLSAGWSLVPIPQGTKGPRHTGWNQRGSGLKSFADLPENYGVGLAHAYTGTMAFDIDSWELTTNYGIDCDALYAAPDAVIIESGKPGHGKLLYRMPFGMTLPSKKVIIERQTAFEFRCATMDGLTVQDVLPPSLHPETMRPYRWAGQGHWARLPMVPDQILKIWRDLLSKEITSVKVDGVDASWEEIWQALSSINPDCTRDEWVQAGMALHWAGIQMVNNDQALALWNTWSQRGAKYPGEREILNQWHSFRADKGTTVTLGTLFHIARQHGWVRPMPDASTLFKEVKVTSPSDLYASMRPAPPEMDLSLWPSVLSTRAQEVSDSVGCDPLVPLFAGLAAVCGVVDAQSRLELMPGFQVPPVLWLMTLGDPADKKSPGSRPMLAPLKGIEAEDRPRYNKEVLDWEAKESAYGSAKKAFLDAAASPEFLMGKELPTVPDAPQQPVPLKITVSDITSQKLVRVAADRPRGVLCHLDEMNAWVKKLTDRSSGEDRSAWVVSYESERYEMDRVGAGSIHAENLAVSIYGNIQPRVFRDSVESLSADGLLQRFIPAILRHDKTRLGHPTPDYLSSAGTWENTLRLVFALPTMTYKLSPDAFRVFRDFQAWYERAKQDERLILSGDTYMTAFGKLEGLAGRIALLFHVIENPFSPMVSASLMERVIRLIRSYIIPAFRYTLGEVGGTSAIDSWLAEYIIQYGDKPSITLSEIKRSARKILENVSSTHAASQMILGAMYDLEQAHWVARIDDRSKEHQHIAEWLINPALKTMFSDHREEVILAKQRLRNEIWENGGRQSPRPRLHGMDDID